MIFYCPQYFSNVLNHFYVFDQVDQCFSMHFLNINNCQLLVIRFRLFFQCCSAQSNDFLLFSFYDFQWCSMSVQCCYIFSIMFIGCSMISSMEFLFIFHDFHRLYKLSIVVQCFSISNDLFNDSH